MLVLLGILLPVVGTCLGSFMVYFIKNLNKKFEILILGFAAGVMIAASVWSLLIPSIESGGIIRCSLGFVFGILLFFFIDFVLNKREKKGKVNKLMLAVTLHNIPEGMAVGVIFASYMMGNVILAEAMTLSLGIAIQNFPEGSVISLPMYKEGYSKHKACWYGVISAIFELMGAVITLLFTRFIVIVLPYLLAFSAGAMIYVVVVELIPESDNKGNLNVLGFAFGFLVMMVLDVLLG